MPDSIIVYRNPLEKMFWESNNSFLVIVFAASMFFSFVAINFLLQIAFRNSRKDYSVEISMAVSLVVACLVTYRFA